MFQTRGYAPLSVPRRTSNAREGSDEHPSAALPLLPRKREGQAWSGACRKATRAVPYLPEGARTDLAAGGSVSNVDIDRNNTLQVKAIGVAISTFETLPEFLYRVSWCGDCARNGENITRAQIVVFASVCTRRYYKLNLSLIHHSN